MPTTLQDCEEYVKEKLSEKTFKSMINFINHHHPSLWGEQQPHNYLYVNAVLGLYKDMRSVSYQSLLEEVTHLPFSINHNTLRHNVEQIRRVLALWGISTIKLGTLDEWTAAARNVCLEKSVHDVTLWMDSKDFPLQGRHSVSRRSPYWSYKCNRPAQRFMFLRDGKGKIRKLWGGYSPKVYDSDWLETHKEWLERKLRGTAVVADNHFKRGARKFRQVKFHCNIRKNRCCKEDDKEGVVSVRTRKQKAYNAAIKRTRARIENTFSGMLRVFKSLAEPWPTTDIQQDYLVQTAAGIFNHNH